ncbi:uncharacterized protein [Haliotis cracherodii]|uniref:uncharacterized protein n=1 Tax=Haliotis cracherodii TaxID=6455 RepID=UPI0039E7730A
MPHARSMLGSVYLTAFLLVCFLHGDAAQDIVCDTELGIATGSLPDANINATSSVPGTTPSDVRYGSTGWCPDAADSDPCIEFRFDSLKALNTFTFGRKDGGEYMKTWDLQTRGPGEEEFETRFTNLNALTDTAFYNVTIKPPMVVQAFRICPKQVVGNACFRFNLTGCADNNELCPNVTCPTGGNCMGPNYCTCPDTQYGSDCSYDGTSDVRTYVSFASSEILANNTVISASLPTLTLSGVDGVNASASIMEGYRAMAVYLKGENVYASLPDLSCFDDLQVCTSFTLAMVAAVQFEESSSTFSLLSSNNLARQQGVTVSVREGHLNALVLAGQYMWNLTIENVLGDVCVMERDPGLCKALKPRWYYSPRSRQCLQFNYGGCGGNGNRFTTEAECEQACKETKKFTLISGLWYRFVLSWNSRGGLELYANGRRIGRVPSADVIDNVGSDVAAAATSELHIGYTIGDTVSTDLKFESIEFWPLTYSEVLVIGNFNGKCNASDCDGMGSIGCYDNTTCSCRKGFLGRRCDQTGMRCLPGF